MKRHTHLIIAILFILTMITCLAVATMPVEAAQGVTPEQPVLMALPGTAPDTPMLARGAPVTNQEAGTFNVLTALQTLSVVGLLSIALTRMRRASLYGTFRRTVITGFSFRPSQRSLVLNCPH